MSIEQHGSNGKLIAAVTRRLVGCDPQNVRLIALADRITADLARLDRHDLEHLYSRLADSRETTRLFQRLLNHGGDLGEHIRSFLIVDRAIVLEELPGIRPSINLPQRPAPIAPPTNAHFLLRLALPAQHRDAVIGDLNEEYASVMLPRFGTRRANFWYWSQVARSISPLMARRLFQVVVQLWKWMT
jgi:hypothetical protein